MKKKRKKQYKREELKNAGVVTSATNTSLPPPLPLVPSLIPYPKSTFPNTSKIPKTPAKNLIQAIEHMGTLKYTEKQQDKEEKDENKDEGGKLKKRARPNAIKRKELAMTHRVYSISEVEMAFLCIHREDTGKTLFITVMIARIAKEQKELKKEL
jgi:hypothetical protein